MSPSTPSNALSKSAYISFYLSLNVLLLISELEPDRIHEMSFTRLK